MKNRAKVILACGAAVLLLAGGRVWAADAPGAKAKAEALAWLKKAREAADRMVGGDTDGTLMGTKPAKLELIAGLYMDLGEIDEAKAIVAELPEPRRQSMLGYLPISLAHAGRFDDAVREAEAFSNVQTWPVLCIIIARKDLPRAMALVEKVPANRRDYAWQSIARDQVLAGNLKAAEDVAAKVTQDKEKERARKWVAAGRLADGLKAGAAPSAGSAEVESELSAIAEGKCSAGELEKAAAILGVLKGAEARSGVHLALAEAQFKLDRKEEFRASIAATLKEAADVDDPVMGEIIRAARYLTVAKLQVRAGDFDEALKTIALAHKAGDAETKKWEDLGMKGGGVFKAFGGRAALVGLLIQSGRTDQAVKMATQEDGSIAPEVRPLIAQAYAAEGRTKEFDALMKSAPSPASECALYIAAAMGATAKAREEAGK